MSEPMYRQIADDLRHAIASGSLAPGSQLPTELDLRGTYHASRNTVREAMMLLISEKLVESRQGHGIFVVHNARPFVITLSGGHPEPPSRKDGPPERAIPGGGEGEAAVRELAERAQTYSASDPQVEIQPASANVAHQLGIAAGELVISRHQRVHIDDQRWSLQTSYYPREVTRGAQRLIEAMDIKEGAVTYLEEKLGLKQVGYRDQMLSGLPDESAASFFGLPDDSRALVTTHLRIAFAEVSGGLLPFRLTKTVYLTARNQFVMNVGRVPAGLAGEASI